MILNGSPRAPKSNSKVYAELFAASTTRPTDYYNLSKTNHKELCERMSEYSDLLLVFPLYADSLPVGLLTFLKYLEEHAPERKPVISVFINCGFLEYQQNDIAVRMLRLFCVRNGYQVGSVLRLGSGEAILKTPYKYVAKRMARKLARSVDRREYAEFQATMPINRWFFKHAATIYWTRYGKRFGVTGEQMRTMQIES